MMWAPNSLAAVLLCVHAAIGQPVSERPTPTERRETDRNGNGKIDKCEESYKLGENLVLRTIERIDEEKQSVQVRLTLVTYQGTPFWTEIWSEGLNVIAVERNCPFGVVWSATSIAFLDKDRNLAASITKNDNGRWVPAAQGLLDVASGMVETLVEFEKEAKNNFRANEDRPANNSTESN